MKEPCKSCDEKHKDLGGCRCQAYMLTGDAANADPVCDKSPHHETLHNDVERIDKLSGKKDFESKTLIFSNMKNSKNFTVKKTAEPIQINDLR
jgi:pyrroloquinoline quinone biosynthesis protein E